MQPFFPFVLLGLAVGLLIWGVNHLSLEEKYTNSSPPCGTPIGVGVLGWFL